MFYQKGQNKIDFNQFQNLINRNLAILNVLIECAIKKINFFLSFFAIFFQKVEVKLDELFLSNEDFLIEYDAFLPDRMLF